MTDARAQVQLLRLFDTKKRNRVSGAGECLVRIDFRNRGPNSLVFSIRTFAERNCGQTRELIRIATTLALGHLWFMTTCGQPLEATLKKKLAARNQLNLFMFTRNYSRNDK